MKKIIFTNTEDFDLPFPPLPASKFLPEWYKETISYTGGKKTPRGDGSTPATIKKCVPVFDAITSGYIIFSQVDIYVSHKEGTHWYEWPSSSPIAFHPIAQAEKHPNQNGFPFPKWNNGFGIETEKGYSCLFTQPKHHNLPFTILDGIVDTDKHITPVNFPFVMNDPEWEGLIKAGTPIAQVIPFKRDAFVMELGKEKNKIKTNNNNRLLKISFFDSYRNKFWSKKEYK